MSEKHKALLLVHYGKILNDVREVKTVLNLPDKGDLYAVGNVHNGRNMFREAIRDKRFYLNYRTVIEK